MYRLGIIGAQSMHTVYFAKLLKGGSGPLANATISGLWGPDAPSLQDAAWQRVGEAGITTHLRDLDALLASSDAVLLLLRDGNTHRGLAEACMLAGKPVFVDKPFACTPTDAWAMAECARQTGLPLVGGSTLCWLPEVQALLPLLPEISKLALYFPADIHSPYNGWCFYGSHLTDLCALIAGCEASAVEVASDGSRVDVFVYYPGITMELHAAPATDALRFCIHYKNGRVEESLVEAYDRCYTYGLKRFIGALRFGGPDDKERLVFSTRLLHGIVGVLPRAVGGEKVLFSFNEACGQTSAPPE